MASTSKTGAKNHRSAAKHNIFLSHSGKQTDFVERLFLDLKSRHHSPFFDKCPESLPKGEEFPQRNFDAARQCELAVVVLSEDFVTTKWSMMELVEFVRTSRNILPLFYKLSPTDLSDPVKLLEWKLKWEKFYSSRIDATNCQQALKKLLKYNGLVKEDSMSEVTYLEMIVESICKRIPVKTLYYVADVQGRDRLNKTIQERFKKISQSCGSITGACVLGIYGIGGIGKTTMCQNMCNFYQSEFPGSACHIELPLPTETNSVVVLEVLKRALRVLTQAENSLLNGLIDERHAQQVLMDRVRTKGQKVFLAVDNVWYGNWDAAKLFLDLPFRKGSRILVTARSSDILHTFMQGCVKNCFLRMPGLEEEEAVGILMYYAAGGFSRSCTLSFSAEETSFFRELVNRWKLGGGKSSHIYHPMLLKALGFRLQKLNAGGLSAWKDDRVLLQPGLKSVGIASSKLIALFRINYDELPSEDYKRIFLDVALFLPPRMSVKDVCRWLSAVHSSSNREEIMNLLKEMKTYGLLELKDICEEEIVVQENFKASKVRIELHDLYKEFAKQEANEKGYGSLWCHKVGGTTRMEKCEKTERLVMVVQRLLGWRLSLGDVKVLWLDRSDGLEELDLSRMGALRSLDVHNCGKLISLEGLCNAHNLVRLWIEGCPIAILADHLDMGCLTSIQTLLIRGAISDHTRSLTLDLSLCLELHEVILDDHGIAMPVLGDHPKLQKLVLRKGGYCRGMREKRRCFPSLACLPSLRTLEMDGADIPDLSTVTSCSIRRLTLQDCNLAAMLPRLSSLTNLRDLRLIGCWPVFDLCVADSLTSLRSCSVLMQRPRRYSNWEKILEFRRTVVRKLVNLSGCGWIVQNEA